MRGAPPLIAFDFPSAAVLKMKLTFWDKQGVFRYTGYAKCPDILERNRSQAL